MEGIVLELNHLYLVTYKIRQFDDSWIWPRYSYIYSAVLFFDKISLDTPSGSKNTGYKNNSLNDNLETKLGLDSLPKFSIKNTVGH